MMLTLEVVFGEAFASSRRFTICEWPCWAACRYKIIICILYFHLHLMCSFIGVGVDNHDLIDDVT